MARARVTSKGQVTIPVEVRRALGMDAGDDLVFEVREERAVFTVAKRTPLAGLRGALPATRPFEGRDAARDEAARSMGATAGSADAAGQSGGRTVPRVRGSR
jgi:antitoxin PrlF